MGIGTTGTVGTEMAGIASTVGCFGIAVVVVGCPNTLIVGVVLGKVVGIVVLEVEEVMVVVCLIVDCVVLAEVVEGMLGAGFAAALGTLCLGPKTESVADIEVLVVVEDVNEPIVVNTEAGAEAEVEVDAVEGVKEGGKEVEGKLGIGVGLGWGTGLVGLLGLGPLASGWTASSCVLIEIGRASPTAVVLIACFLTDASLNLVLIKQINNKEIVGTYKFLLIAWPPSASATSPMYL